MFFFASCDCNKKSKYQAEDYLESQKEQSSMSKVGYTQKLQHNLAEECLQIYTTERTNKQEYSTTKQNGLGPFGLYSNNVDLYTNTHYGITKRGKMEFSPFHCLPKEKVIIGTEFSSFFFFFLLFFLRQKRECNSRKEKLGFKQAFILKQQAPCRHIYIPFYLRFYYTPP